MVPLHMSSIVTQRYGFPLSVRRLSLLLPLVLSWLSTLIHIMAPVMGRDKGCAHRLWSVSLLRIRHLWFIRSSCICSFTICPLSMCGVLDSVYGPEKSHQVEDKIVFLHPDDILSCKISLQFMAFPPHGLDFTIRQGHLTWSNVFSLHKQKWSDVFHNVQLPYCVTVFVRTDN